MTLGSWVELLASLGLVVGWTLGAQKLGAVLTRPLPACRDSLLRWVSEAAIGFLFVAHLLLGLVLLGWAGQAVIEGVGLSLALLGLSAAVEHRGQILAALQTVRSGGPGLRLGTVSGLLGLLWLLMVVALPVTSVDELIYHLEIPRKWLQSSGTYFFADNFYAYFPQLGELLFLPALAWVGPPAARLLHGAFGILLALSVFGMCRTRIAAKDAVLGSVLFLTVPSVMVGAGLAYVDLMMALYGWLALVALLDFFQDRLPGRLVFAGVLAGGACSTKYTGLQLALILALIVLVEHLARRRKSLPWTAAVVPGVAFLVFSPYFVRNWISTGWPLFPFPFGRLDLNQALNWDAGRGGLFLDWLSSFGLGGLGFLGKLLAPVDVFVRGEFSLPMSYDGVLGPVFLLAPFLVWPIRRLQGVLPLVLFCLVFACSWSFTSQQARFLFPVLPALSALIALGLPDRSSWLKALLGILVAVNLAAGLRQQLTVQPLDFWLGRESSDQLQRRSVIGFPIYEEANSRLGENNRLFLVNMRNFGYLLNCSWTGDFVFEHHRLGQVLSVAQSESEVVEFFRSEKVTHLMIDERITFSEFALHPSQQERLRSFLNRRGLEISRSPEGQVLYQLELGRPEEAPRTEPPQSLPPTPSQLPGF